MRSANRDSTQENDRHSQLDQQSREAETPILEFNYEGLEEEIEQQRHRTEADELVDTAHTDGSTDNPMLAQEQGLVYLPPSDPPVLPSDDPQGAEIAAGFASSIEETEPGAVDLPDRVSGNELVSFFVSGTGSASDFHYRIQALLRFGLVKMLVYTDGDFTALVVTQRLGNAR